jgi:hypothetical protein
MSGPFPGLLGWSLRQLMWKTGLGVPRAAWFRARCRKAMLRHEGRGSVPHGEARKPRWAIISQLRPRSDRWAIISQLRPRWDRWAMVSQLRPRSDRWAMVSAPARTPCPSSTRRRIMDSREEPDTVHVVPDRRCLPAPAAPCFPGNAARTVHDGPDEPRTRRQLEPWS